VTARHRRTRWGYTEWLHWLGACVLLYAAGLAGYMITAKAAGRLPNAGEFSACWAAVLAVVTVLIVADQSRRVRRWCNRSRR
jgi:hypothetical protein